MGRDGCPFGTTIDSAKSTVSRAVKAQKDQLVAPTEAVAGQAPCGGGTGSPYAVKTKPSAS